MTFFTKLVNSVKIKRFANGWSVETYVDGEYVFTSLEEALAKVREILTMEGKK